MVSFSTIIFCILIKSYFDFPAKYTEEWENVKCERIFEGKNKLFGLMKVCIGMHGFRINFHVEEPKENLTKVIEFKA